VKDDARAFLNALLAAHDNQLETRSEVRLVIESYPMPWKRKRFLLRDKWSDRGWWNYGVTWASGWLTPEGIAAAREEVE